MNENYQQNGQCPKTWLVESIVATVLCCLPLGVAGIIYASKVENLFNQGRTNEAQQASDKAKMFTLIAAGCGIVAGIIAFIVGVLSEL